MRPRLLVAHTAHIYAECEIQVQIKHDAWALSRVQDGSVDCVFWICHGARAIIHKERLLSLIYYIQRATLPLFLYVCKRATLQHRQARA